MKVDFNQSDIHHLIERRDTFASIGRYFGTTVGNLTIKFLSAIMFGGVDFDDPNANVQGRRALAIAKPTPRGY